MRVLHLTLSFSPGGRREAILTLARGLVAEGVATELACVDQMGCDPQIYSEIFEEARALNRDQVGMRRAAACLAQICAERRINLIHAHDASSQWLATQARLQQPRVKVLMTFHRSRGFESAGWKAKVRNAAAGFASTAIVVGSRERQQHYLGENYIRAAKVVRIPFGIDLNRFRPDAQARQTVREELGVSEDGLLIGAVGHFGSDKGIDLAVQAFVKFQEQAASKDASLVVVGRGTAEQEKELRQLASSSGNAVRFAGFREDVQRYFAAMDMFLHLPRIEAFGLVVSEAMACGLPVIGADIGGVPDMVRHEITGLLTPSEQPQAAADALLRLAADEPLRGELSEGCLRVAQTEYSQQLYVSRHVALYQDILSGCAPRNIDESVYGNETRKSGNASPLLFMEVNEACDV